MVKKIDNKKMDKKVGDKKTVVKKIKEKKESLSKKEKVVLNENKQIKNNEKQIKNKGFFSRVVPYLLLGFFVLIVVLFFVFSYIYSNPSYKGISYKATSYGEGIILYDTVTLLPTNDGSKEVFGFRLETHPFKLKMVPFEDSSEIKLMKLNGYKLINGTFSCGGHGAIGIDNMEWVINNLGGEFYFDPELECDPEGRYNAFMFQYGDKTQIKKLGKNCYSVIIKGDDSYCEIRKATDKIMAEFFSKWKAMVENK
jgi:hypothetical protein